MKTLPTTLPDVVLLELDVHTDHRGQFMETFNHARYRELARASGLNLDFVQDNLSSSVQGTLRGLHYQLRQPQGKLVHVTRGEVFDVAVDIRRGSSTFGKWFGARLCVGYQMWIPPGYAHGFFVMSDVADFAYKCTAVYAPADERTIAWNDPELAISWPTSSQPKLSARDAAAPKLRDAELPDYVP
jgi:dTDP-4-dehydrorhamnose 3,5-epimerase